MDYQEFRKRVNFIVPNPEQVQHLLLGLDSIHIIFRLGTIDINKNTFAVTLKETDMETFCEIIDSIENRGAVFGKDYFTGGNLYRNYMTIELHTTTEFLSDEDVPLFVRRVSNG